MNLTHPNRRSEKNGNEKTLVARLTAKAACRVTNKYYAHGTPNDEKKSILASHPAQGTFRTCICCLTRQVFSNPKSFTDRRDWIGEIAIRVKSITHAPVGAALLATGTE